MHKLADFFRPNLPDCAFYSESLHKSLKLFLRDIQNFLRCSRPDESTILQAFIQEKKTITFPYQSLDFTCLSATEQKQSVLLIQVERDSADPAIRTVRQIKNSLGPSDREISFEIRSGTGFRWLECKNTVAADISVEEPTEFSMKKDKAAYLIKSTLLQGDMAAKEMYVVLEKEGISHRTAEDVRKEMGICCYRKGKHWFWSIHPDNNPGRKE